MTAERDTPECQARAARVQATRERTRERYKERDRERAKARRKAQAAVKRAERAKKAAAVARENAEYAARMAAVFEANRKASAPVLDTAPKPEKSAAGAKRSAGAEKPRETPKEYSARYYREVTKPRNEALKAQRTESDLLRIAENRSRAGSLAYANRVDRGNVPPAKPKPLKPAARIDWEALGIPTVHVHSHAARDTPETGDADNSPAASHWFKATRLTHTKET